MAYFDIDKKANGIMAPMSSSFMPRELPYQFSGAYGSQTQVKFPYAAEWFQITAVTSTTVTWSFVNTQDTKGESCGAVAGNTTSPIFHINCDEIWVKGDAHITVMCTNILSGTADYNLDNR